MNLLIFPLSENLGEFNILPAGELAEQLKFAPFPGERWRYPKTLEERINEVSLPSISRLSKSIFQFSLSLKVYD